MCSLAFTFSCVVVFLFQFQDMDISSHNITKNWQFIKMWKDSLAKAKSYGRTVSFNDLEYTGNWMMCSTPKATFNEVERQCLEAGAAIREETTKGQKEKVNVSKEVEMAQGKYRQIKRRRVEPASQPASGSGAEAAALFP